MLILSILARHASQCTYRASLKESSHKNRPGFARRPSAALCAKCGQQLLVVHTVGATDLAQARWTSWLKGTPHYETRGAWGWRIEIRAIKAARVFSNITTNAHSNIICDSDLSAIGLASGPTVIIALNLSREAARSVPRFPKLPRQLSEKLGNRPRSREQGW